MAEHRLRALARQDIKSIWFWTAENWSERQARHYVDHLLDEIEHIADTPHLGRPADQFGPGYRMHSVGSHVIFYQLASFGVDIVRVLHERMDFLARLKDEE